MPASTPTPAANPRIRALVAHDAAREAREDRREGRIPRALRDLPVGRSGGAARTVRRHSPEDRPPPTEAVPNMSGTLAALHAITSGEVCPAFRKTSPGMVFRGQEPARCASSAAIGPYRRQGGCMSASVAATLHHSDDSIWGIPVDPNDCRKPGRSHTSLPKVPSLMNNAG